jgi:hypothetical protein
MFYVVWTGETYHDNLVCPHQRILTEMIDVYISPSQVFKLSHRHGQRDPKMETGKLLFSILKIHSQFFPGLLNKVRSLAN